MLDYKTANSIEYLLTNSDEMVGILKAIMRYHCGKMYILTNTTVVLSNSGVDGVLFATVVTKGNIEPSSVHVSEFEAFVHLILKSAYICKVRVMDTDSRMQIKPAYTKFE